MLSVSVLARGILPSQHSLKGACGSIKKAQRKFERMKTKAHKKKSEFCLKCRISIKNGDRNLNQPAIVLTKPSPNYPPQSSSPQSYFGFRVWVTAPPLPFVPKHSIRRLIPLTVVVGSLAQFYCFFCSRLCDKAEGCFPSATCAVWTSGTCTKSTIYSKSRSPTLPPRAPSYLSERVHNKACLARISHHRHKDPP